MKTGPPGEADRPFAHEARGALGAPGDGRRYGFWGPCLLPLGYDFTVSGTNFFRWPGSALFVPIEWDQPIRAKEGGGYPAFQPRLRIRESGSGNRDFGEEKPPW